MTLSNLFSLVSSGVQFFSQLPVNDFPLVPSVYFFEHCILAECNGVFKVRYSLTTALVYALYSLDHQRSAQSYSDSISLSQEVLYP